MKPTKFSYFVILLFVLSGCRSVLAPTTECQPLSTFDTIIISPVASNETIVEENEYDHLPPKIAALSTMLLKENIEDGHMFKNILKSPDCAFGAIKIDSKIISLIHKSGKFRATIRGAMVECKTGAVLYRFQETWSEKDSSQVANKFAIDISRSIKKQSMCKKTK